MTIDKHEFWYVAGDVHGEVGNLSKLPDLEKCAGLIISGDLTNYGDKKAAAAILNKFVATGKPVFAQLGNMDLLEVDEMLTENGVNLHAEVRELAPDVAVFGIGGSTPTPMNTPTEFAEEKYSDWLEQEWREASRYPHTILISHNPPKDTICDDIGGNIHVGSVAVREFIEKFQPEICICGHIHEGEGIDHIGTTVIINPGAFAAGGYVKIFRENGKISASLENVAKSAENT